MANINAINNRSYTLTVDNALTVTAGGATVSAGGLTVTAGTTAINDTGNVSTSIGGTTSTGPINIGTSTGDQTIHIGFGVANKTIVLGVANGTTSVDIESGSGGATLNSVGGSTSVTGSAGVNIDSASGTIGVGTNNSDRPVSIGTLATAGRTITIGNATGTTAVNITAGSGKVNFTGSITSATPIPVAAGGTGAGTLTGVLIGNGTSAVTANAVTQHDVLIGGASNAITSVAPSATSGVALISQGAAADPAFGTVVVAGGGTGAVTLTGVLTGNGTSAVTANAVTQHGVVIGGASNAVGSVSPSATAGVPLISGGASADPLYGTGFKVDSSGRNTNANQPAFVAYLSSSTGNNVTGDGTVYTLICDTTRFDQNSNYNTGTGTFTAPIAGKYYLFVRLLTANIGAAHNPLQALITASGITYNGSYINAGVVASGSSVEGNCFIIANMAANDTATFKVQVSASTKTVGVIGGASGEFTYCGGYLVC